MSSSTLLILPFARDDFQRKRHAAGRAGGGEFSVSSAFQLFSCCYLSAQAVCRLDEHLKMAVSLLPPPPSPETAQTAKQADQIPVAGPAEASLIVFQDAFERASIAGVRSLSDGAV